jgi:hypothetical protein
VSKTPFVIPSQGTPGGLAGIMSRKKNAFGAGGASTFVSPFKGGKIPEELIKLSERSGKKIEVVAKQKVVKKTEIKQRCRLIYMISRNLTNNCGYLLGPKIPKRSYEEFGLVPSKSFDVEKLKVAGM